MSLPPHVVAELRQHWREQQEQRLGMGMGRASDTAPVLATIEGGYMNPDSVSHAWVRQMETFDMSSVTLHSLRHTHASMLISSGIDILTVSRRLGHASPTVTLNVYSHLVHGSDDKAARSSAAHSGKW